MIDQTGVQEGYVAVVGGECKDCAFVTEVSACVRTSCLCDEREDGLNVIFIKKTSEPATLLHPMGSLGEEI